MKKKGFTLIELLAVIVVLAVIALIAVPVVLNLINTAKKGAFKASAYAIRDAASNFYIKNYKNKDDIENKIISITELDYKGDLKDGNVIFNGTGFAFLINQDEQCAFKYVSLFDVYIGEYKNDVCKYNDTEISLKDLAVISDGDTKVVSNVSISDSGEITYSENNSTSKYIISSDGKIKKDGKELESEDEKNNVYGKLTSAILEDTQATTKLLENQSLIDGFKTNESAMNTMLNGLIDYFDAQSVTQDIKNDIDDIISKSDRLVGGTASIQQGKTTKDNVNSYLNSLKNITNHSDIIIENFDKILESDKFTDSLVSLDAIDEMLFNNEEKMNNIFSSSVSFNIIANNEKLMKKVIQSQAARNALYNNYTITEPILASSNTALSLMEKSDRYQYFSVYNTSKTAYEDKAFVLKLHAPSMAAGESTYLGKFPGDNKSYSISGGYGSKTEKINRFVSEVYLSCRSNYGGGTCSVYAFKI